MEKERRSGSGAPSPVTVAYGAVIAALGRFVRFPSVYWWSASAVVRAAQEIIARRPVDVIVATHPYALLLRAGSAVSKRTGVPWVADMRDGWSSYYFGEYRPGSVYYTVLRRLERRYLASAARVVSINATLAETLQSDPKKLAVVPNVFDPEQRSRPAAPQKTDGGPLRFAFAGSVHESHSWNLFFDAVAEIPSESWQGRLRVDYYGGYHHVVEKKRRLSGVPDGLVFGHGYLERNRLYEELEAADVLLVFGFNGEFGDSVTTGKIFDYIEIGRPIVVIGPESSELARLVTRTGVGVVLSDVAAIRKFLEAILHEPRAAVQGLCLTVNERALAEVSAPHVARRYARLLSDVVGST